MFGIPALTDERLIGFVGLRGIQWSHGTAMVTIAIGDARDRGRGDGKEALNMILRYAFTELNLHRLSLNVFEYNRRAIRCYEKAGFVAEGQARQFLQRDGRRWDLIYMGILESKWEQRSHESQVKDSETAV